MSLRDFFRRHLMKILLIFILLQIAIVALVQTYNNRPVAESDETTVIEGKTVKINPMANDMAKGERDELKIQSLSQPLHGTVKQKVNLLFYTPVPGFAGIDSFAYTITNGKRDSKKAYIRIHVNRNTEPTAIRDEFAMYMGDIAVLPVLDNDRDQEGDSIFIKNFSNPVYGQIQIKGNQLFYKSGNSPSVVDSFTYSISDGKHESKVAMVRINLIAKNNPCYPWLSSDIGNVARPGSFSCSGKSLVMKASGTDIWNTADGFRFAYQYVHGDCELIARIDSLTGSNEWAKGGLMVRESLRSSSKMATVCLTTGHGACVQHRVATSNEAEGFDPIAGIKPPYWLKLKRTGDSCIYNISADGKEWKRIAALNLPMTDNYYIGFALSSHNNSETGTVVFGSYKLSAKAAKPGVTR